MGTHPVCKVLASLTLFLLVVYHTNHDNGRCHAAPSPLTDAKRDGYSRLTRAIKNHTIVKDKVPPGISLAYKNRAANDSRRQESDFDHEAVNVNILLMPIDILSLDPAHQVLEMSAYIRLWWWDTNLAWNASDYEGVEVIEMTSSDMWTPIITVLNGVENNDLIVGDSIPLCLQNTGLVSFTFSVHLKTSCALDLRFFPFDTQSCSITLYSPSELGTHIISGSNGSEMLRDFTAGGEWSLTGVVPKVVPGFEFRQGIKHTLVILQLKRKSLYYIVGEVVPMALFTVMNCLVFLIPLESGEKISFLVSIFISNTVFSSFVNGQMPKGLDTEVPLLMVYLIFMWVWSILTFLATVFVISRFHAEQAGRQEAAATATSSPAEKKSSGCVKARTLDRFFLVLSLLTVSAVDSAMIALYFRSSFDLNQT